MKKSIALILILTALSGVWICTSAFAPSSDAGDPPKATHFDLPTGYTTQSIRVVNQINDFSFRLIGCYQFDRARGCFTYRVYKSELEYYIHYLQSDGYTFDGFTGWQLDKEEIYYTRDYLSINAVELSCKHTPITYEIVFKDGITGSVVQTFNASYGSTVKAPSAPDYADRGLVFVGWDGGDYETVVRNTTLYSTYAPARYITVTMPDETIVRVAVPAGSKLSDAIPPEYPHDFVRWEYLKGGTVDGSTVIDYDIELRAVYADGVFPTWAITLIATVCALIIAAIVIAIALKLRKRAV